MTELEAVNQLLWAIGQTGISSLDAADTSAEAEAALVELRSTARQLQERGWTFNTEEGWAISPDAAGAINLPRTTLKVRSVQCDRGLRLVERGGKLYDKVNHTFAIGSPVTVDLVLRLDFEDLPASARWLITVRAARRFGSKRLASPTTARLTQQDEQDALVAFEQDDAENDNRTMREASPHVARMKRR